VAAAAGAAAPALTLAGCGVLDGGDGTSGVAGDRSGLLSKPEDTTARAVRGGILPSYAVGDTPSFDGNATPVASYWNDYAYTRLLNFRVANLTKGEKVTNEVEPYGAESWEVSPDGLHYTFKLRPDGALDPRPPTNGRVVDAQDFLFAWSRFKAGHRNRGVLSYEVSPSAPIESVTAPDARTIVIKLAFPIVSILQLLAYFMNLPIVPREADAAFNPRQTMRGSGPWMLTDYRPSLGFSLRRNPNFHMKERPFLDGVEMPIISEYAQGLAQFKAGNIFAFGLRPEDVLQTKADVPALRMLPFDAYPVNIGINAFFSLRPGSPFRDERLRQALSMLIDRDLFIDTRHNVSVYEKRGLPRAQRWASFLPPGEESFWLDPQGPDFGPNARYYKYNPAEARKLMQAAGNGVVEQPVAYIAGAEGGPGYREDAEVLVGMWNATGDFKLQPNPVDYNTVFFPRYGSNNPRRDFEGKGGVALGSAADPADVDGWLSAVYSPAGGNYRFEPDFPNDARFDSLIKAQRVEFDPKRRAALLHDLQRHAAAKMYTIHRPGFALGYGLTQPWLMNPAGVFGYRIRFVGSGVLLNYWLAKSST
jgi:ABC-type transport system substrate-binding protein